MWGIEHGLHICLQVQNYAQILSLSRSPSLPPLQVNSKWKGTINVPREWTAPENHSQLQAEVMNKAREAQFLESCVTVTKVIIVPDHNTVNFVSKKS